jgi:hypothetical protein
MSHCPMSDTVYCPLSLTFYTLTLSLIIGKNRGKRMDKASECGCGRSPTGNCIGWHSLSDLEYQVKRATYEKRQAEKAKK